MVWWSRVVQGGSEVGPVRPLASRRDRHRSFLHDVSSRILSQEIQVKWHLTGKGSHKIFMIFNEP